MNAEKKKCKLAIVDDHNLFRKGLIKLVNLPDKNDRFEILFEASNGNDLKVKLNTRNLPDIIIMDIDMPETDGFEAVEWLRKTLPDLHILVISMFESEDAILRMLKMGVSGYLSKDIEVEDINKALNAISDRGCYYSDFVSAVMAHSLREGDKSFDALSHPGSNKTAWIQLSDHEKQFLRLACTELTYQQIADEMNLSPKTIDGYREALVSRFHVRNRVSLATYAVRNGYVKL